MSRNRASAVTKILAQEWSWPVPMSDDLHTIPAWIEVEPDLFVSTETASIDQLLLAADMHAEIARRHRLEARKLREYAALREGPL